MLAPIMYRCYYAANHVNQQSKSVSDELCKLQFQWISRVTNQRILLTNLPFKIAFTFITVGPSVTRPVICLDIGVTNTGFLEHLLLHRMQKIWTSSKEIKEYQFYSSRINDIFMICTWTVHTAMPGTDLGQPRSGDLRYSVLVLTFEKKPSFSQVPICRLTRVPD